MQCRIAVPIMLALSVPFAGCGGGTTAPRIRVTSTSAQTSQSAPQRGRSAIAAPRPAARTPRGAAAVGGAGARGAGKRVAAAPAGRPRARRAAPGRPPVARPLPRGGWYRAAPRPQAEQLPASDTCASVRLERPGKGRLTRLAPPRPGLSAALADGRVEVRVDPGNPPEDCRPIGLLLTVDNDRGIHETAALQRTLDGTGPRTLSVEVPSGFTAPPNVVHAITVSAAGLRSQSANVRLG